MATPAVRDKIKVSKMGLPLDGNRSDVSEASDDDGGADGVAVSDEDPAAAPALDLVPRLADERDGVEVGV